MCLFAVGVEVAAQGEGDAEGGGLAVFVAGSCEDEGSSASLDEVFKAFGVVGCVGYARGGFIVLCFEGDLVGGCVECDGHGLADGFGGAVVIDVAEDDGLVVWGFGDLEPRWEEDALAGAIVAVFELAGPVAEEVRV